MAAKPALTETGERLYNWLLPLFWTDEEHEWAGAVFCSALATMLDPGAAIVEPQQGKPGYAILLDPELCPEKWLPWLCQFVGVDVKLAEALVKQNKAATVREWIKGPINLQRGSAKAMKEAALLTLTGAKTLYFYARWTGAAYIIKAASLTSQTPNPTETREALESMMPAWCVLQYETITGGSYATLEVAHGKYSEDESHHATYSDMETNPGA